MYFILFIVNEFSELKFLLTSNRKKHKMRNLDSNLIIMATQKCFASPQSIPIRNKCIAYKLSKKKSLTICQFFLTELALITDQPRAATVIAVGSTRVAKLPRDDFTRLLGPCKDIMKRNAAAYEEQLAKVFGSKNNVTDLL